MKDYLNEMHETSKALKMIDEKSVEEMRDFIDIAKDTIETIGYDLTESEMKLMMLVYIHGFTIPEAANEMSIHTVSAYRLHSSAFKKLDHVFNRL